FRRPTRSLAGSRGAGSSRRGHRGSGRSGRTSESGNPPAALLDGVDIGSGSGKMTSAGFVEAREILSDLNRAHRDGDDHLKQVETVPGISVLDAPLFGDVDVAGCGIGGDLALAVA